MVKYSAADLAAKPNVAAQASSVRTRVQQVIDHLKGQDNSAADTDKQAGKVHIQEDVVTVHKSRKGATVNFENAPPGLINSNAAVCLANGKMPIHIEGDPQVTGFKGMEADLAFDPSSGAVHDASVVGYELIKPNGFAGPATYSYSLDKHGRGVYDVNFGGWHETAVVNSNGTIAQYRVGDERHGIGGFLHDVWDKVTGKG
jgi:hypothetical protein